MAPKKQGSTLSLQLEVSEDHRHILRSTPCSTLLNGFSKHFVAGSLSGQQVQDLYALSHETKAIGDFISHSWRATRLSKYVWLTIIYNARPAAYGSLVASLITGLLFLLDVLPETHRILHSSANVEFRYAPWPFLVGMVVLFVILFQWQRFLVCCAKHREVFFDRVCICQTDDTLKDQGIKAIGAFLAKSGRIVILWSPEYLTRLWCVYEVSVFNYLSLGCTESGKVGSGKVGMIFVPLALAIPFAFTFAVACFGYFMYNVVLPSSTMSKWLSGPGLAIVVLQVATILAGVALWARGMAPLREYILSRRKMEDQLSNFSVERAECFLESDRKLVTQSIRKMFGTEGLHVFDGIVQGSFKTSILSSWGDANYLPYEYQFLVFFPALLGNLNFIFCYIRDLPLECLLGEIVLAVAFNAFVLPPILGFQTRIAFVYCEKFPFLSALGIVLAQVIVMCPQFLLWKYASARWYFVLALASLWFSWFYLVILRKSSEVRRLTSKLAQDPVVPVGLGHARENGFQAMDTE